LLWENLSITLRRQVWNLPESPLQQLQQVLQQRLQRLRADLADPDRPLFQLKAELDNFMVLGLLTDTDKALVTQLDQASAIERRLADLDRQDLWDASHLATVNEIARLLDGLPGAISEGRGWRRRLERQQRGIAAWDHLEIAWTTFRGYFDGIDTGFHRNPSAWREVILRLDGWCRALAQWVPEVDWSLPGAGGSQRWLMLVAAWQATAEGRLWLAANKPLPANPTELQQAYSEMLQQVHKFAELHAELLRLIPTYIPDPDPDLRERLREPLNRLHESQPLSRPVRDIRQQLTDAEVSHVGNLYHRLFQE